MGNSSERKKEGGTFLYLEGVKSERAPTEGERRDIGGEELPKVSTNRRVWEKATRRVASRQVNR